MSDPRPSSEFAISRYRTETLFPSTVLASMVGVIYFLVVPEMKNYASGGSKDTTAIVLRTLKPDERKVVSVLDAHGGVYLQKYITQEAGLSRLKTYRSSPRSRSGASFSLRGRGTPTKPRS